MNKLLLYGEIGWEATAKDIVSYLDENKDEQIEMHVNSPGGDVFEAIAIRAAVMAHKNITIVVDAMAASAAAIISLCGKPLKMSDYSRLMLHSASTMAWGNSKEMEEQLKNLNSIDDDLARMISEKMGKSFDEVREEYFDGKDHWLTADEVIGMGVAEKYISEKTENKSVAVFDCINGVRRHSINNNKIVKDMDLTKFQSVAMFQDCQNEEEILAKVDGQATELEESKKTVEAKDCEIAEKDARIAELEAKLAEKEEKERAAQEEADNKVVEDAIKDGRIEESMKETYVNMMRTDRENTSKVIASLKKPQDPAKVEDFMKGEGEGRKKTYFEDAMAEIANRK